MINKVNPAFNCGLNQPFVVILQIVCYWPPSYAYLGYPYDSRPLQVGVDPGHRTGGPCQGGWLGATNVPSTNLCTFHTCYHIGVRFCRCWHTFPVANWPLRVQSHTRCGRPMPSIWDHMTYGICGPCVHIHVWWFSMCKRAANDLQGVT